MATNFPTALDTLTNPAGTHTLDSPVHTDQHSDANDAIEALEAKVGIDSSAVTTSHDYKLSGVTGTDVAASVAGTETLTNKTIDADNNTISNLAHGAEVDNPSSGVHGVTGSVVGTTDTQTLTNKTLTAPKIADAGFIADANGNELVVFQTTASAENHVEITNAADGGDPQIAAVGDDTNINLDLVAKGSGKVVLPADTVTLNQQQVEVYVSGTDITHDYSTLGAGVQRLDSGGGTYALVTIDVPAGSPDVLIEMSMTWNNNNQYGSTIRLYKGTAQLTSFNMPRHTDTTASTNSGYVAYKDTSVAEGSTTYEMRVAASGSTSTIVVYYDHMIKATIIG